MRPADGASSSFSIFIASSVASGASAEAMKMENEHRRPQLDSARAHSRGAAIRTERSFVDHGRAHIVTIDVESQGVVRYHGDLVAFALERDRPLAPTHRLAHIGGDGPVIHREAAVVPELHADAAIVERYLVTHQRRASSRAARAQGGSAGGRACRSPRARVARTAASAAADIAPSERSGATRASHRSTKPVSYRPVTKS